MLLDGKTAVVYGAGAIGGAVAGAFAREGARVFLASRTRKRMDAITRNAEAVGRPISAAVVDAMDPESVEDHLAGVVAKAGAIDISFNTISLGGAQGTALVDMTPGAFLSPIETAMWTQFITMTAAARHMQARRAGVLLAITAQVARKPYPDIGGFGVACAAIEGLCRQLAVELGPSGIRVACLRSAGSPDAPGVRAAWTALAESTGTTRRAIEANIAERTALKRLPRLSEVADAAVLLASDRARAITAEVANLTAGELVD